MRHFLLLALFDPESQRSYMRIYLILTWLALMLCSCATPTSQEQLSKREVTNRCDGCGRVIKRTQDMRAEMCSVCDWRFGAGIGWP